MTVYKLVSVENKKLYSPFAPKFARVRYIVGKETHPRPWLANYGIFAFSSLQLGRRVHNIYSNLHLYEAEAELLIQIPHPLDFWRPVKLKVGFQSLHDMTLPAINLLLGHHVRPNDFCPGSPTMESVYCASLTLTRLVGKTYTKQ